ncbi:hypothetical protein [Sphingobium fuliginis]|uniref:hypothetical protein n=1 Tax=Sphingobium fuliginis (strain ATCC 27551) TaxID=336203 RepID=UPI0010202EDD|nr:hypothetical protein [Sphingobium fuliginis]RYL99642.1 hypothetical protein EWH10_07230 [Sphingobium fuliginis]
MARAGLARILLRPNLSRRLFTSQRRNIGAESTSKHNVNNFGTGAEPLKTIAGLIMERLAHYGVQILTNGNGALCFFTPSPGHVSRPWVAGEYAQGLEDGAIKELQQLVRASPVIAQAIMAELTDSGVPSASD